MPPPAGRLLRPDSTRKDLGVAACAWGEYCGAGLQPKCAFAEANQGHLKQALPGAPPDEANKGVLQVRWCPTPGGIV